MKNENINIVIFFACLFYFAFVLNQNKKEVKKEVKKDFILNQDKNNNVKNQNFSHTKIGYLPEKVITGSSVIHISKKDNINTGTLNKSRGYHSIKSPNKNDQNSAYIFNN